MTNPSHTARLSIRIDLPGGARIGPGKMMLLEAIARHGSISAAGRALGMSYRRAWELVDAMNGALATPVIETSAGGAGGGGARLTPTGADVLHQYRTIEQAASDAARPALDELGRMIRPAMPAADP